MNVDEIIEYVFKGKETLIHRPALAHLCRMAQIAPPGLGVEIGVYLGRSLACLAMARIDKGDMIGIDDWSYPDPPDLEGKTRANLERYQLHGVELYSMTSEKAAALIPGPLAFVHIDGNHTYDYVRRDIELYAPKIMSGGVMAFHDYGRHRADIQVQQAVDEWQAKEPWQPLGEILTTIGFKKP